MAYNKKLSDKKKSEKFIITGVQAYLSSDANDKILDQVNTVLNTMPFNRFSIPLNAYRESVLPDEVGNKKCLTVGFIKKYDKETGTFNVVIFDTFKSVIETFNEVGIEINFGSFNGELTKINKLILVNVPADDADADDEENDAEPVDDAK